MHLLLILIINQFYILVVNQKNEPTAALHLDIEKHFTFKILPRQIPPAVTLTALCAEF